MTGNIAGSLKGDQPLRLGPIVLSGLITPASLLGASVLNFEGRDPIIVTKPFRRLHGGRLLHAVQKMKDVGLLPDPPKSKKVKEVFLDEVTWLTALAFHCIAV